MNYRRFCVNTWYIIEGLIRYNIKIIFANKFLYFLLAAIGIFLGVTAINLFNPQFTPTDASAYWLLLIPGILLVFYPATFGIQNDVDTRMIEILFGIPNYRYKVWFVRLVLIDAVTVLILLILTATYSVVVREISITMMMVHLIIPTVFIGSIAFLLSTIIRSGNGTALVMVIVGVAMWTLNEQIGSTEWYIFFNPYQMPDGVNEIVWADIIFRNRAYLLVGTLIAVLWGLLNLQNRERFI